MFDQNLGSVEPQGLKDSEGIDSESVGNNNETSVSPETPSLEQKEKSRDKRAELPQQSTPPPITPQDQNIKQVNISQGANRQVDQSNSTSPQAPVGGLSADDKDIIEKEWVGKAKDVISNDKGKPYKEEEDHEDLQIDYLKKRFGKDIKKSED